MKYNTKKILTSVAFSAMMAFSMGASEASAMENSFYRPDAADQVKLIVENRDMWDPGEMDLDVIGYMVTDLDDNGRLEILVSQFGGTGQYTYTDVFEVNEAKDGLAICPHLWDEHQPEMDVMMWSRTNMYTNGMEGVNWYVFQDHTKDRGQLASISTAALSLERGEMHIKYISSVDTNYDDMGRPFDTFRNGDGAVISYDDYQALQENPFPRYEKKEVAFPWLMYYRDTFGNWKSKSPEDLQTMLMDTYLNFTGEKTGMG